MDNSKELDKLEVLRRELDAYNKGKLHADMISVEEFMYQKIFGLLDDISNILLDIRRNTE